MYLECIRKLGTFTLNVDTFKIKVQITLLNLIQYRFTIDFAVMHQFDKLFNIFINILAD